MKENKKKRQKKLINFLIIGAIIGIMMWIAIEEYKDNTIKRKENNKIAYTTQNVSTSGQKENEELKQEENTNETKLQTEKMKTEQLEEYPKEEVPEEYEGYQVSAKLEIPSIKLETYILSTYSKNALNISVTKFWGADPNKEGNFCIAGHNFQNKNMFHNIRKLKVGNTLFVSDNEVGKVEYEIYDIYTVEPEDVTCLSQQTAGKKEVTLITCTTDSKKRIIVKAREN